MARRIYLIVAVAGLIGLSSLPVAASGPRKAPLPDAPGSVYVYWCQTSRMSGEKTCRGSTTARPSKPEVRAR